MPLDIFLSRDILSCLDVLPQLATLRKRQGYPTPGLIDLEFIRFVRASAVLRRDQSFKLATAGGMTSSTFPM